MINKILISKHYINFTGLSGAGKTTVSFAVEEYLVSRGIPGKYFKFHECLWFFQFHEIFKKYFSLWIRWRQCSNRFE